MLTKLQIELRLDTPALAPILPSLRMAIYQKLLGSAYTQIKATAGWGPPIPQFELGMPVWDQLRAQANSQMLTPMKMRPSSSSRAVQMAAQLYNSFNLALPPAGIGRKKILEVHAKFMDEHASWRALEHTLEHIWATTRNTLYQGIDFRPPGSLAPQGGLMVPLFNSFFASMNMDL